jgi:polar amino acid transport system substrate-binding protein
MLIAIPLPRLLAVVTGILSILLATLALAADAKTDLAPTGTLRGIFLGRNPVQGMRDPATGEYSGAVPDMLKEIARNLGVPYRLIPGENAKAVMDAVNGHTADIGFLAYDESRGRVVDFSVPFYLMFNAYLVRADSPFQKSDDVDRPGVKVGATTGQTQQIFLSETLRNAKVVLMQETPAAAEMDRMLETGEVDAFGQNRERSEAVATKYPEVRVMRDNFSEVGQSIVVEKGDKVKLPHLNAMINEAISSGMVTASLERAKLAGVGVAPLGKAAR